MRHRKVIQMMFCPKCGSLLKTKQVKNTPVQFCSCGYSSEITEESSSIKEEIKEDDKKIEVIEEGASEIYPITDAECPKCKHGRAFYWMKQTRAGDEPETKFFKCESCKHIWRDYS